MQHGSTPKFVLSSATLESGVGAFVRRYNRQNTFSGLFGGGAEGHYLGRYRLSRLVGQGGMGVVFAAHDETLDRQVAIKLVRARGDGHARLLRESQALARLSHPNVVHVYEIGEAEVEVDADEEPTETKQLDPASNSETIDDPMQPRSWVVAFIVMEFIDGQTLDTWLGGGPSRTEILEAFAAAGSGLAAAHEAGLVHRDFKPQNVMLGSDGRIRVMDFGLARDTDGPIAASTLAQDTFASPLASRLTQTEAVLGTPLYMAPEQLAGQVADARSDQFGFCVALYEALYGERPFRAESFEELVEVVGRGERAPEPAAVDVPAWLKKVLLRGLATDPDERWPSMHTLLAALAADPALRRRKRVLGLGLAALFVGGIGLALTSASPSEPSCTGLEAPIAGLWHASRQAEVEAAFEATGLSYADDTWKRVRAHIDDYVEGWTQARVETCEAALRGERSQQFHDASMACLDGRADHLRASLDVLAKIESGQVGNAVVAVSGLPSLERCADFDALMAEVAPPEDPRVAARVEVLREQLVRAKTLQRFGDRKEARKLAEDVFEQAQGLDYEPLVGEASRRRAALMHRLGDSEGAVKLFEEAYMIAVTHGMAQLAADSSSALMYILGSNLNNVESAEIWAKNAEPWAKVVGTPVILGGYFNDRGILAYSAGELLEARDFYRQSIAIQEQGLEPGQIVQLAKVLANLGGLHRELGEYGEARQYLERSLAICEASLGPTHPDLNYPLDMLGSLATDEGNYEEAVALHQRGYQVVVDAFGPEHPLLLSHLNNLGRAASHHGQLDEAKQYYERSLALALSILGPDNTRTGSRMLSLGVVALDEGQLDEARSQLEHALKIFMKAPGPDHLEVAQARVLLGKLARLEGDFVEARGHYEGALEIRVEAMGADNPSLAEPLVGLGEVALDEGDPLAALEPLERALALFDEEQAPVRARKLGHARARFALARALWEASPAHGGSQTRARELAELAYAGFPAEEFKCAKDRAAARAWLDAREDELARDLG